MSPPTAEPDVHLVNWYEQDRLMHDVFAPIGVSYIAASLQAQGFSTRVQVLRCPENPTTVPSELQGIRPGMVGISATGNEVEVLQRLSTVIKETLPSTPIVAGGILLPSARRGIP